MTHDLIWSAPGPGSWSASAGHFPGPRTAFFSAIFPTAAAQGWNRGMADYGIPFEVAFAVVNRHIYMKAELVAQARWAALEEAARRTYETRRWRDDLARWNDEVGPAFRLANLALQSEPLDQLDDLALADHLERVGAHLHRAIELHMELVAPSLPVGDFLAAAVGAGMMLPEAVDLLGGGSPATQAAVEPLRRISVRLREAGVSPDDVSSLDDLWGVSAAVSEAFGAFMVEFGWRMTTAHDVDGRCLVEMPSAVLASIRAATVGARPTKTAAKSRASLASDLEPLFVEARALHGLEDDNAAITWVWPLGLARRALLEVGRRLASDTRLHDPGHVMDAEPSELVGLLRGTDGPTADELRRRADERVALERAEAPSSIGEEGQFDLDDLPAAARKAATATLALFGAWGREDRAPLHGTGVGAEAYRGRARLARDVFDVLECIEDGDVLVVPFTTPAFNVVLLSVGGLVVEEGGPLDHAAVLARELDIPAVIGARDALTTIHDGDIVEVDPAAGRVVIIERTVRGESSTEAG
jgi:pyruvate,water dikinase